MLLRLMSIIHMIEIAINGFYQCYKFNFISRELIYTNYFELLARYIFDRGAIKTFLYVPDSHAFCLKMVPSLVHFIQSSLEHNGVILTSQRTEKLSSCPVQRSINISMGFDFGLKIL